MSTLWSKSDVEKLKQFVLEGKYNDYEIDILRKNSRYLTVDGLLQLLPLRTKKGITYKCKELGLSYRLSKKKCEVIVE